jgi:hypothetical protein
MRISIPAVAAVAALFVTVGWAAEQGAASKPGAPAAAEDMAGMHAKMAKSAEVRDVKVPKATGPDARTVEEIVTDGGRLKNKNVVVRGTVVKVTRGVLGKNWVHLQDGSGVADKGTHDVLVTTQDDAKIGDVVVAKGVVNTDIDLGSGYAFKVLVEKAKLQK